MNCNSTTSFAFSVWISACRTAVYKFILRGTQFFATNRDRNFMRNFFSALRDFSGIFFPKGSPLQFFCCFATEWMLENPKGSPLSVFFGTVRFFSENKIFPLQFFDVLRQNPFNCDKNIDNFGSVPLSARQGLALAGPGAPVGPFFEYVIFSNFRKIFDFRVL